MATEQLQGLVGVVAATVGAEGLIEQGIPPGVVKAELLAGPHPGGDQVIRAGGEGHIDAVIVPLAQAPQHRQGADQLLALQADPMDGPQLQIGEKGEQGAAAAHQLDLGVGVIPSQPLQEGQQEEVVADAVGAANDQDPPGRLR